MNSLIDPGNTWMLFAVMASVAAVAIWLEQKYSWAAKLSACVICLILSMLLANTGVIPSEAAAYDFIWDYVIPMSIPMLLYNADIRKIWRESGRLLGIFLLGSLGSLAGGVIGFFAVRGSLGADIAKAAASMFTGTYVGGSVNLVAMSEAADAPGELVSASIVADNLVMALYFFVLVAIPGIRWISRHYSHTVTDSHKSGDGAGNTAAAYWHKGEISLTDTGKCIAFAAVIVAVSVKLSGLFEAAIPCGNIAADLLRGLLGNKYLLITTITALLATYLPAVFGNIGGARELGTYLIHIFFAVIGAPASIVLVAGRAPALMLLAVTVVLMNMLFSLGFGKLFGYSIEEICTASNANIGGPTTAAAYAVSKGWDVLVLPALLVGTLGYVIGNYYGVLLLSLLK